MEILVKLPDETWEETKKFIDSCRNWDVEKQRYRDPGLDLSKVNVSVCQFYWRGKYLIVEHGGMVHFYENGPYNYFFQAIQLMQLDQPAEWKTLDKLLSFRQAIRQTEVNCCEYVDLLLEGERLTLQLFNKFMKISRKQDRDHHGSSTF